jgi:BlaI family transcriptional regulator, penicillinase repressor
LATADTLSKRERQIVEALYAMGEGGAREITDALREPEAFDTVRVTLGVLEKKGLVRHRTEGRRHIYSPAQPKEQASRTAWRRLTKTFFGGNAGKALITFLDESRDRLDDRELDALEQWVAAQSKRRRADKGR